MNRLILLRHGESTWNRAGRFTGWTDVDLTEAGIQEARDAAALLREHDLRPTFCFASYLKRAIRTLWILLDEIDLMWLPVEKHWRLNERHYGALQGLDKAATTERVGKAQVHAWRRSYATRPPALEETDDRFPGRDPRYAGLRDQELPRTESLQDTVGRFLPCWRENVVPRLQAGGTILISAHGNSLRALVKHLEGISDEEISNVEIPTGNPLYYELDTALRPRSRHYLRQDDAG